MDNFLFYTILLVTLILLFKKNKKKKEAFTLARHQLGPEINTNTSTNRWNNNHFFDNDPNNNYKKGDYFIIRDPYDNSTLTNFMEYTTKRSLALSSIREILEETKLKLNNNSNDLSFDTFDLTEINDTVNNYKPIIDIIILIINNNDLFKVLPISYDSFKIFKKLNKYYINLEVKTNIISSEDDEYSNNGIFKNVDYGKYNLNDVLTTKDPLILKLIIQFVIRFNNIDSQNIKNNFDIYIKNLSAIKIE
jgi:hypothetical protein